ncbi:Phox-like protein [Mycena metata]|uniref:Endosomal/vacuolar adapter protein YPT35 n=1 Tax=Mycena metata TaxID=1033252 RepID=A0AAD7NXE6_9AGAR|nr:Phox-like protein [Mycena metata]
MSSPHVSASIVHPFAHSTNRLEIIRAGIDVEEESRLYDDLVFVRLLCAFFRPFNFNFPCFCTQNESPTEPQHRRRSNSPVAPPSVFSNDIWLGDNSGESAAFAREVQISGWTSVGDALGGAYVVYDCVMKTKEGTQIHAHKRYSDFAALESQLLRTLPRSQRSFVPELPPKAPLARYRTAFLASRRRALEHWLSAVLLHPDVGGCEAVRRWVMN